LLQTFADQAVIAIENARLFDEVQAKTRDLEQSLQQQTATADVLKIISRSSVDLETVLDTLVETVARLCRADQAVMFRRLDAHYHPVASHGLPSEAKKYLYTHPLSPDRGTLSGRVELERRPVHIDDVLEDPEYSYQEGQKIQGYRTMLGIPLLREDALIGIFVLNRTRVEPFTDKEIELAASFADQAVIAIENARLFEELRDRQAELRVTFDNMGDGVVMFDAAGRLAAWNRNLQEMIELPEAFLAGRPNRTEYFRYLADRGEFSADLEAQLGRTVDDTGLELRYERMRPDGRVVEVRRNPVPGGGFVLIYSDITQRKRAEEAIRAAKDAAESALRELQTAQASLVHAQKMAALGQLTAGIAHEIKNPLNFVNNFAGLSVELLDELKEAARAVGALDPGKRAEIVETIGMLTGNLEKIVEHGRRADGIVRSMLQHSRGSSDDRQATDLNALTEEALNLAYHGARAQDPNFDIALERDLDSNLVPVDVVPQELTRVLLNLIGNGLYAANKRSRESDGTYRPALKVTTREFGESVEVRVRDNGVGVPPENRDKLFQPFFTTKPTGEGTGLGLSISYDIITQQHGGTITVDSEVGDFTEFTVRLPRSRHAMPGRPG
jgi:PAS domain S-box-containing protein